MSDSRSEAPTRGDAETTALGGPAHLRDDAVEPGTDFGRYVVLESVARGGMGHVLRAYDPKLQREVAIKVVRADATDTDARDRMLREARAMAKLSHPNVVAVYDAEETDAGVVLVMEYVPGQTLHGWCRDQPRRWWEIVACFRRAGRGLAAAHAADLLHRDFKPANVLVSDEGDVKVTDFGLAKHASATGPSLEHASVPPTDSLDGTLTRADTVLGTPRYMSPEQHRGEPLGPAADQYAFCVALWEALTGAPPFRHASLSRSLARKEEGPGPWPTDAPAVPRLIEDALRRGMSPRAAERWPTMHALLEALAFDPTARRRRWQRAIAATLVVGAVGTAAWSGSSAHDDACSGAEAALEPAWGETRRAEVEASIDALDVPFGATTWTRTAVELDGYAARWIQMHTEACEATTVRGDQSAEVLDLRMACLTRARTDLSAVADVLTHADVDALRHAHGLVEQLPSLDDCADIEALRAGTPPPSRDVADRVERVRGVLAAARAEETAGRDKEARARIDTAGTDAAGLDYPPLHLEIALAKGRVLAGTGEDEAAEAALVEALSLAARLRQPDAMATAATRLIRVVGVSMERPVEGLRYLDLAQGLTEDDPEGKARLANVLCIVRRVESDPAVAVAACREALKTHEGLPDPDPVSLAMAHSNVCGAEHGAGHYAAAEAECRDALARFEAALGRSHPDVAMSRGDLASVLDARGELAEAEQLTREAVEIIQGSLGLRHPNLALAYANLGTMLYHQHRFEDAVEAFERGLGIAQDIHPPDHPDVARAHVLLGTALAALADYARAEVEQRRALEIYVDAHGAEHLVVARTRALLATTLHNLARHQQAAEQRRLALEIREAKLPDDHPELYAARMDLAESLLALDRAAEGLPLAEQAWDDGKGNALTPEHRATSALILAELRWVTATDARGRQAAREAAKAALATYADWPEAPADAVAKVQRWLDGHA